MTLLATAQLAGPDYFVLVGYFVLMLGIGVYFYRFMRGMKDYFSGGNNIPWWLSGVSFYMSSFSATAFVFYPALCYKYGWVGVTALWVAVPATLFSVLFFAKKWRRARIDSPVEYTETRYGPALRQLFAWQGVPVKIVDDGMKLVAIATFISVVLEVQLERSMVASGLIILAYTFMGGLWAVAVTDFVQFVVLSVAVVIVLPLSILRAMEAAGATTLSQLAEAMPDGFFNLTSPEYDWIYISLLILLYCLAWSSINWPLIQRYYCVPREKDALKVGWLVVALYIVGPPLMFLPAMAATQFLPGLAEAKNVYPALCAVLLPAGVLGLVVAAMFSATMSMLSSDYNVCAGVLTNDVYRRLIRKNASQRELVAVGRTMTVVIGLIALGVGWLMVDMGGEDLFRTMVTLFGIATAPVAVPMLLGLISKRMTNLSALLGFAFGLSVGVGLYAYFYHWLPEEEVSLIAGMVWHPKAEELVIGALRLKMELVLFACNALVTLVVMVLVRALVPASWEEHQRVAEFHKRLETPIGQLDEDRQAQVAGFSPFPVVGISIAAIGLMLLAIVFWVEGALAQWLTAGFGGVLLVLGSAMARWSQRQQAAEPAQPA
ncbi:MAG: hypothetical protein JW818_18395 [Pirellulales bacterium]|nr:hypothetical protein [Pirellulales bacterium]